MKPLSERVQQGDPYFRWRGAEVSRLEALFDMVLALALTLTMISTEVPQTFADLWSAVYKLPTFGVCFVILLMCWYYHFQFHRRYGIENFVLTLLSGLLLFVVVAYVYPLKFIYAALLDPAGVAALTPAQGRQLVLLYSGGFSLIFLLFFLMTLYAYLQREALELNDNELVLTKMALGSHLGYLGVGLLSVGMALTGVGGTLAGRVYILLGPVQFANGYYWGKQLRE